MIPLHLSITGFLSYRETAEIDFNLFELACIAGANGAGKSSLLDAITWALFGQARKRDDSLINAQSEAAEVCLTFAYESNIYRVQRTKPRDKTSILEFFILQGETGLATGRNGYPAQRLDEILKSGRWKPLTERSLRETEARICSILRMDYETFVNAAFFLQGKADQFTQQRPGDRKRILGSILGLEIWETYRARAADQRKDLEGKIAELEGRLQEISAELREESERKARLKELESDLERINKQRSLQETNLEAIRQIASTLADQRKLVEALANQLNLDRQRLEKLQERLQQRQQERAGFASLLERAEKIERAYAEWQQARRDLEKWEGTAERFREFEKRREGPRDEINTARARLSQQLEELLRRRKETETVEKEIQGLEGELSRVQKGLSEAESQASQRTALESKVQDLRERQAEARVENGRLMAEMKELRERIERLHQAAGVECPLCGQPMGPEERSSLIASLELRGKEQGDRYRANRNLITSLDQEARDLEGQMQSLQQAEEQRLRYTQEVAQLTSRVEGLEARRQEWQKNGALRLAEVEVDLKEERFAPEARQRLAAIDQELKAIGYDAAEHDRIRRLEASGRGSDGDLRALESARATLAPLEREIHEVDHQLKELSEEVQRQTQRHSEARQNLEASEEKAPDLYAAEHSLLGLQEQENRMRMEVGAARQKVTVLDQLKSRRKGLEAERDEKAERVSQYRHLERAFSKDGVPALLIEQALPQIEAKSNEILERLSGGAMSVRFITQAAYKDKRRDDLKETLDIQISDGAGARDYEMFSGGEAFRVNFAIRLALSEVLAQRAGARLQTLVIDEGFGSQDALGRQRLIEAINLVRQDFAKILVITHIDELKEAFPNRIEVEKTERGSAVRVV